MRATKAMGGETWRSLPAVSHGVLVWSKTKSPPVRTCLAHCTMDSSSGCSTCVPESRLRAEPPLSVLCAAIASDDTSAADPILGVEQVLSVALCDAMYSSTGPECQK